MYILLHTKKHMDNLGIPLYKGYEMGNNKHFPANWNHLLGGVVEVQEPRKTEYDKPNKYVEGDYWMIDKGLGGGTISSCMYEKEVTKQEDPEYFL